MLGGQDTRVIYRHYATLYFVFVVDESESELGILDLIQVSSVQIVFFSGSSSSARPWDKKKNVCVHWISNCCRIFSSNSCDQHLHGRVGLCRELG